MPQEEMLTKIVNAVSTLQESMSTMQKEISTMNKRLDKMDANINRIDETTESTHQIVARMEIEHGQKLGALFDADTRDHEKIVEDILPRLDKHDQQIDKLEQHVVSLKRA